MAIQAVINTENSVLKDFSLIFQSIFDKIGNYKEG